MKIARFRTSRRATYGVVDGNELIEIRGSIYTKFRMTDIRYDLDKVRLMAPTEPFNIWGPGMNFPNNPQILGALPQQEVQQAPEQPQPRLKARSSMTGHGEPIIIPKDSSGEVHFEGEAVAAPEEAPQQEKEEA